MHKRLLLLAAMALASVMYSPSTAEAFRVSKNNPYRTFNISGRNYGSYQWERRNSQKRTQTHRVVQPRVRISSPIWRR